MDNTNIDNNLGSSTASAHEEVSTAQGHNKTGGRSSTQGKQSESVDTGAGSEAPKEDLEKPHGETSSKSVDGYPGEAREDPSVPTWTDKETGTVYKKGDKAETSNPLEDGSVGKKKEPAAEKQSKPEHESLMDKAKHMVHKE